MNDEIKDLLLEHGVDCVRLDPQPSVHALEYDLCLHPRGTHPRLYIGIETGGAVVGVRAWEYRDVGDRCVRPRGVRELVSYARDRDWYIEGDPDQHLPTPDDFM